LEEEMLKQKIALAEQDWLENAQKPISYEPKVLNSIKDLECSKRVTYKQLTGKEPAGYETTH
jgi:hypothetical protein